MLRILTLLLAIAPLLTHAARAQNVDLALMPDIRLIAANPITGTTLLRFNVDIGFPDGVVAADYHVHCREGWVVPPTNARAVEILEPYVHVNSLTSNPTLWTPLGEIGCVDGQPAITPNPREVGWMDKDFSRWLPDHPQIGVRIDPERSQAYFSFWSDAGRVELRLRDYENAMWGSGVPNLSVIADNLFRQPIAGFVHNEAIYPVMYGGQTIRDPLPPESSEWNEYTIFFDLDHTDSVPGLAVNITSGWIDRQNHETTFSFHTFTLAERP